MKNKEYRYSEIFGETFQGEGKLLGSNTLWLRWFGCNFTCHKFGQSKDPEKYIPKEEMYYNKIDITDITHIDQLPIQNVGCDSFMAWSPRFRHLAFKDTAHDIAKKLIHINKNEYNPEGLFIHPKSGQDIHLCFTGGESMMSQDGIIEVLQELKNLNNAPLNVTIETNGSQKVRDTFIFPEDIKLFWSISPKLESASGEPKKKAIRPDLIQDYNKVSSNGQLKFVCDNSELCWEEIEEAVQLYREAGINWDVYIMPEGAEQSAQSRHDADIAVEAIKRGYYFTSRVHATVFGAITGK